MPPDFSHQNLRGRNFKGQDLTGANFSHADIRGANFTNAILKGANFVGTKAGLQRRWMIIQTILSFVLSILFNFIAVFFNTIYLVIFFRTDTSKEITTIPGLLLLFVIAAMFWAIARQGLTAKAMMDTMTVTTVAVVIAVAVANAGAGTGADTTVSAVAIVGAVVVAVAIVVADTVAGVVIGTGTVAVAVAVAGAVAVTIAVTVASTIAVAVAGTVAGTVAVATVLFSFYVAQRALSGDEKFTLVRTFGVAFGAMGGTNFCGADLTEANFTGAILKSTNFNPSRNRQTILDRVCWKNAKKLDRARVGDSLLANRAVRDLLANRDGYKKSYVKADLRGANLAGVNLNQANLQWADLSAANLQQADLRDANLREILALGADFTGACLTGACIEAWNIDHTTKLDNVDCQCIYLMSDQQERRPSSGDFAPGEFTKLFQEVLSTVDLIFRNGVDWKAFVAAFQQVQVENEGIELAIQSIENKGDGVVVVRVSVPVDADKAKIHSEFNQNYEVALKALEAKYQAELQAKEGEIAIYREQSGNMWGVINSLANRPVSIINENKLMNNSPDQSRKINVGGNLDILGSTINLGEISGNVTNTIHQLQQTDRPHASELAELLTQLQTAIESDPDLSATDKTEALEQVSTLAKAGQNPQDGTLKKLASTAIKVIKGTVVALPATATLVEAVNKLLLMD